MTSRPKRGGPPLDDPDTSDVASLSAPLGPDATSPFSTRAVPNAPGHALVQRFWVLVAKGPDAGATFTSAGERAVIGTHESADFVLHDPTVSRFHCDITPSEGRAVIRDLGSRNGTSVDGVSLLSGYLRPGSTLTLGETQLRFDLGKDHVKIPLSERERFGTLVGRSGAMRRVFALLEKASASDATVLPEGETGTGKEATAES